MKITPWNYTNVTGCTPVQSTLSGRNKNFCRAKLHCKTTKLTKRDTDTRAGQLFFFFQVSYYFTENTDFCSFGKRLDSSSRKIVNRETKKARRKGVPSTENSMNQTHKQEHTEGLIYVLSLCNMRKIQTARSMDRWWRNAAIQRSLTGSQLRDERWMTCKGVA